MGSNFTVIQFQRQHFGNQPASFNDVEPDVPFVGRAKDFVFDCPNVNPDETAVLLFESRAVSHRENILQINGVQVFGGLPVTPSRDMWNGNVLLVEPHHGLRETSNVLRVESRDATGGVGADIDDFIIDNVVIAYKIKSARRVLQVTDGDDITAALQTAITQATRAGGYGGEIVIPEGAYYLSSSIVLPQVVGMHIRGRIKWGTRLIWNGASSTQPMFDLNRCQSSGISDLGIEVSSGRTLFCAWRSYNSDAALTGTYVVPGQLASRNFVRDVDMQFAGRATYGIRVCWDTASAVERGKNDHHHFERVQIQAYTHSGVVLQGDQPQANTFDQCQIQGRNSGLYGINCAEPIAAAFRTVGFTFRNGTIMENQYADIYYPRNYGDTLLVDGVHSEGSRRFFEMPDFAQDASNQDHTVIVLRNVKHHSASSHKTISSFDDANDRLTVTGHGYVTGQGPLFVENTGGSLPTGLATNTQYFAIVVDANRLSLATSVRNAQSGVKVPFSGTGSGTNAIEWPEASDECVRIFCDGPVTIDNCAFGKENESYNRYRIRVQGRSANVRSQFSFNSLVSHNSNEPVFTAQLPTEWKHGYRRNDALTTALRANQLVATIDNGRQRPATGEDWLRVLGIVPRSWYRFHETYGPVDVPATRVDASDNELDIAGHSFTHLDGPVRLSTTGSLPDGLLTGTDYWVIVRDSESIALATTRNSAIANVAANITSQGIGTHTITPSSAGLIYDCNTRQRPLPLNPTGAPKYRQPRSGFDERWAEFVSGTVDQCLHLNDNTEVNPQRTSVAFLVNFGAVTLTATDEYLCALGSGSAGAGGGPMVRFTSDGLMRATIDGVTQDGSYDYQRTGDYLTIAGCDRSAGGVFTVWTDREVIVVSNPSLNVGNDTRKGLGTGSSEGTFKTAGFQVGLFAVFVGNDAEKLIAMGSEVHKRMGW
jgi:hypothetical protein